MSTCEDLEFSVSDGTVLRGWYFKPAMKSPWPIIVMSHGFGVVKEMALREVASSFAAAGFGVMVYDHRNLGASDGTPRQEVDPFAQLSDARDALTVAQSLEGVDPKRLGIWGTSYSGGHVLFLAATDRRVKAVVAQVPTVSGSTNARRRATADELDSLREQFAADRASRLAGEPPVMVPNAPGVTDDDFSHDDDEITATRMCNDLRLWLRATPPADLHNLRNELTLRSHELYATYEPGSYVGRIAPVPLMIVCMDQDTITPTDEILRAYGEAREPKKLLLLPGGHCDVYGLQRDEATAGATDWFAEHL